MSPIVHRGLENGCRCMECCKFWRDRAEAARKVLRHEPGVDPLLLLSYVVWPGPMEIEYRQREAA